MKPNIKKSREQINSKLIDLRERKKEIDNEIIFLIEMREYLKKLDKLNKINTYNKL